MSRQMQLFLSTLITGLLLAAWGAQAAPPQLLNKTIDFNWTTEVVQRGPRGRVSRPRITAHRTVYVSTAGRLFARATRQNRRLGLKKRGDFGPDATITKAGEARGLRIVGNTIVGHVAFARGAAQVTVSFDPSFSICSLHIVYGKEDGRVRRRGLDGIMRELLSQTVTSQSCAVRPGNPFAEG